MATKHYFWFNGSPQLISTYIPTWRRSTKSSKSGHVSVHIAKLFLGGGDSNTYCTFATTNMGDLVASWVKASPPTPPSQPKWVSTSFSQPEHLTQQVLALFLSLNQQIKYRVNMESKLKLKGILSFCSSVFPSVNLPRTLSNELHFPPSQGQRAACDYL